MIGVGLAGCTSTVSTRLASTLPSPTGLSVAKISPSPNDAVPTRTPATTRTLAPSALPLLAHAGRVLDRDGQPAAGVAITATLISQDGGGLISQDGGGIIASGGGNIIAQGGGNIIAQGGGNLRLLATGAPLTTTTDAQGNFTFALPAGTRANVEAVRSDDLKAIAAAATTLDGLTLKLDFTGTLTGKVSAPQNQSASDFEGTSIYLPGTGYAARAAKDGSFTVNHIPVGSFRVRAEKAGLGVAAVDGVTVRAHETTQVPPLALNIVAPDVTGVSPDRAGPGAMVTVTGANFGAGAGTTFGVTLNGVAVDAPKRLTDKSLTFRVPTSATSGSVVVTVDNVPGKPARLTVLKELKLASRTEDLHPGEHLALTLTGTDTEGKTVPVPPASWTSTSAAVQVDDQGTVTAAKEGAAWVSAGSGNLSASVDVGVFTTIPNVTQRYGEDLHSFTLLALDPSGVPIVGTYLRPALYRLDLAAQPPGFAQIAGVASPGFTDGVASQAAFGSIQALAISQDGTLYVGDGNNHRLRMVKNGQVSTIAGNGASGSTDGPGASATFTGLDGLALDGMGHMYVADSHGGKVRVVDLAGADHAVTTLGAALGTPTALALDGKTLYVATSLGRCIYKVALDTGTATAFSGDCATTAPPPSPAPLGAPANDPSYRALAVGPGGRLVAGGLGAVYQIYPDGSAHYLAGNGVVQNADTLTGSRKASRLQSVCGLAFDAQGNLWSAQNNTVDDGGYELLKIQLTPMP
jgi:sugar lactone lactonase YvrE